MSPVQCPNARSRKYPRPDLVAFAFQVSRHKIEPVKRLVNLFAKDDERAALDDEPEPGGPEMPLVSKPSAFACRAERLARTGSSPDGAIVGPSGEAKGVGPAADPGEEVTGSEAGEVCGSDIPDIPCVYLTLRQMSGGNEVPQPVGGIRIDLVVVMHEYEIGSRVHATTHFSLAHPPIPSLILSLT